MLLTVQMLVIIGHCVPYPLILYSSKRPASVLSDKKERTRERSLWDSVVLTGDVEIRYQESYSASVLK